MNFIVREGDKLCTPALTHCHVVEAIGPAEVVMRFKGGRQKVARWAVYDALSQGTLMVLERAV